MIAGLKGVTLPTEALFIMTDTTITITNPDGTKWFDLELSQRTFDWLMSHPDPSATLNQAIRYILDDPVRKADFLRKLREEKQAA